MLFQVKISFYSNNSACLHKTKSITINSKINSKSTSKLTNNNKSKLSIKQDSRIAKVGIRTHMCKFLQDCNSILGYRHINSPEAGILYPEDDKEFQPIVPASDLACIPVKKLKTGFCQLYLQNGDCS